jgi:hypothetical protein
MDCNTNTPIAGATSNSFTPAANGSYAVIVTKNGCIDTSSCPITTSSGKTIHEDIITRIYPNPVRDLVSVVIDEAYVGSHIQFVDLMGRSVLEARLLSKFNQIELTQIPAGLYFLVTTNGERRMVMIER